MRKHEYHGPTMVAKQKESDTAIHEKKTDQMEPDIKAYLVSYFPQKER